MALILQNCFSEHFDRLLLENLFCPDCLSRDFDELFCELTIPIIRIISSQKRQEESYLPKSKLVKSPNFANRNLSNPSILFHQSNVQLLFLLSGPCLPLMKVQGKDDQRMARGLLCLGLPDISIPQ